METRSAFPKPVINRHGGEIGRRTREKSKATSVVKVRILPVSLKGVGIEICDMNKRESTENLVYYLKLYSLALMYAKHPDQIILYAFHVVATAIQIKVVQAHPEPKFEKGSVAIVGHSQEEKIMLPDGTEIKIKDAKSQR